MSVAQHAQAKREQGMRSTQTRLCSPCRATATADFAPLFIFCGDIKVLVLEQEIETMSIVPVILTTV